MKIIYFILQLIREDFKPKIQRFAKYFITKPLLSFLAVRGPPISPTGMETFYGSGLQGGLYTYKRMPWGPKHCSSRPRC